MKAVDESTCNILSGIIAAERVGKQRRGGTARISSAGFSPLFFYFNYSSLGFLSELHFFFGPPPLCHPPASNTPPPHLPLLGTFLW